MWVITDGTIGTLTDAVVVERIEDLAGQVKAFRRRLLSLSCNPDEVTVNPVGPPVWDKAFADED